MTIHERVTGLNVGTVLDRSENAYEDRLRPRERMGMLFRSLKSPTTELTGTIGIRSPMRTLPDGLRGSPWHRPRAKRGSPIVFHGVGAPRK